MLQSLVNSDQSNSIVLFFLYRIVWSCSQDGGCMAADYGSVSVELLYPTTCKCTGLVEHCVLNCVAGSVFVFWYWPTILKPILPEVPIQKLQYIHGILTPCDFGRGGAMCTKPIIGSSRSNNVKNRLNVYQVQKRPNIDYADCFSLTTTSVNALATLFGAFLIFFCRQTHTHTHTHTLTQTRNIALPLLCMREQGNYYWVGSKSC